MSTSDSYIIQDALPESSNDQDEIDTLPSSIDSSDLDSDDGSDAQRQWEENLQQIELALTMVVIPYAGKYFGRKFAYWAWAKWAEWKWPVEVTYTNKTAFKAAGAVEAAATL
ncbi:hypothetical protein HYALB_00002474 [Hymenoscyphus albidus]|uniref:Uncharacterized protein n=1 Tax=Hymenoscyphus albidus TaxID=595503 RepID=A0A9N9LTN1_9HELO|nr:hypothetical protein HYALB_00002474 [Hymenoscyphus albidus]